jgi:hypothetical protein
LGLGIVKYNVHKLSRVVSDKVVYSLNWTEEPYRVEEILVCTCVEVQFGVKLNSEVCDDVFAGRR